jgi:YidC/Oxa1 family membrane protein insertase
MEKRILIAFVLSAVIFAVWSVLFPPPKPVGRSQNEVAEEGRVETAALREEDESQETEGNLEEDQGEETAERIVGESVERVVLENDVMKVELSNQGARVESLVLKGFEGDDREPLDLVQTGSIEDRTWPLQMVVDGAPDERLFHVERQEDGVRMVWSDGRGAKIEKSVVIPKSGYGIGVEIDASGAARGAELSLGTGMRDTSIVERKNRFSTWGDVTVATIEDRETYKREKTREEVLVSGSGLSFAGMEDTYFLNVYRPKSAVAEVRVIPLVTELETEEGELEPTAVLRVDLGSEDGRFAGELFAAPKEYDLLQREGQGLQEMLRFGIFHPIAVFFLKILRWIYGWVGNWGWAIVLLTIALRIVLFPLMHKSTVSMRRMQKIQPKVKAIQEKYRKNKTDPQVRAKMNQETMALYKEEGVNPMGGCLPILVQMPILFALYTLFAHAIELRHAPFMAWIVDLSAKDPLYITPVLMTATMWLQQRLAPQAGDPQQMRIMRVMPLVFGVMFLGFPSGLVLYWLTNNVVSIIQQEITLHMIGERGAKGGAKKADPKVGKRAKRKGNR